MSHQATDDINKALAGLHSPGSAVKSALLVGADGTLIGSSSSSPTERAQLSAVSAASFAIGRKAARNLTLGDLERIHMKCKGGSVVLVNIDDKGILALVLSDTASPDTVLTNARSVLQQIGSLL